MYLTYILYVFHELLCKKRLWLFLSLSTDFKWLALRLGLGMLCMITNSAFFFFYLRAAEKQNLV